jgi:quercetin dioxygenase-like cupin family protein
MKGQARVKPLREDVGELVELIDYQNGSVVSREIIKGKTGTVTLFAFDEGQGLSEHTSPYDALIHVLEGNAEITISGKPFLLGQGEAIIMPAKQPHGLNAQSKVKLILTMIQSMKE